MVILVIYKGKIIQNTPQAMKNVSKNIDNIVENGGINDSSLDLEFMKLFKKEFL